MGLSPPCLPLYTLSLFLSLPLFFILVGVPVLLHHIFQRPLVEVLRRFCMAMIYGEWTRYFWYFGNTKRELVSVYEEPRKEERELP